MIKEAFGTGATVEQARQAALELLNAPETMDVQFEIIDLPAKKALGLFGGNPAKVRVFYGEEEVQEQPAPEAKSVTTEKSQRKSAAVQTQAAKPAPQPEPQGEILPADTKEQVYLTKLLTMMGVQDFQITARSRENGMELNITGEDVRIIIGRRGETLDALQYLTSLTANRGGGDYRRITINIGDYREKREKTLKELARKVAAQVSRSGRNSTLEPMNPYERRIIHTEVQEIKDVISWSIGEEPYRSVVIGTERGKAFQRDDRFSRDRGRFNNRDNRDGRNFRDNRDHRPPQRQASAPAGIDSRPPRSDTNEGPRYGKIN